MTFYVHGLNAFEVLNINKVLKKDGVEKTAPVTPVLNFDEKKERRDQTEKQSRKQSRKQSQIKIKMHVAEVYESVGALPQSNGVVLAKEIMSSTVVTLSSDSLITDALKLFQENQIRHLPVVSSSGQLIGMVSERDVLHYLSGVTKNYQQQTAHLSHEQVSSLMISPVLTASEDTDIRYIARLFVERRVGALPIVSHSKIKGIIARSDVLTAVMRHFILELWA